MALRTVGGGGEADLDMRAITDEQDIVELQEPDPIPENGASDQSGTLLESEGRDAPNGPRSLPAAPVRTAAQEGDENGGLGAQSDEEFDRWASHSGRRLGVSVPRHDLPAGTAHLPGEPQPRGRRSRQPAGLDGRGAPRSRRTAKSHVRETPWRSLQLARVGSAVVVAILSLVAVSAAAIILDAGEKHVLALPERQAEALVVVRAHRDPGNLHCPRAAVDKLALRCDVHPFAWLARRRGLPQPAPGELVLAQLLAGAEIV